jgi:hypothetical protein
MESLVLIPGILMAVCVVSCFVLIFKVKRESINAPALVRFFGLEILSSQYLTEKGKSYRAWYWRLFLLAFVFAAITVLLMYFLAPEFQLEFSGAS